MEGFPNFGTQSKTKESCGTCTDFKDWMNQSTKKANAKGESKPPLLNNATQSSKSTLSEQDSMTLAENAYMNECPLQRNQFGKYAWGYLHTMAAYYPNNPTDTQKSDMKTFIRTFTEFFPCEECKDDFKIETKKSPPRLTNGWELSQWFCEQHNLVNTKLGKEKFDCSKVFERWKLGSSKNPHCE